MEAILKQIGLRQNRNIENEGISFLRERKYKKKSIYLR